MLEYVHKLPTASQREGVTHASVGRTIIDNTMLHAQVTYGTLNSDGEFEEDPLSGTHKLVVEDMELFLASPSGMDTLPDTTEDLLQDSAAGLASYADAQELWPGL
jgi:hypothetical protein